MEKKLKTHFKTKSVRFKLLFFLIVISIIPTLILGYIGYFKYTEVLKEKFLKSQQVNIIQVSSIINQYIENIYRFTQEILYDDSIYNFSKLLEEKNEDPELFQYLFKNQVEGYLNSLLLSRYDIDLICFKFSQNSNFYFVSRNNLKIAKDDIKTIHSKALKTGGKPVIYIKPINNYYSDVYIGRIVYDRDTLEEIGLLILKVDLDRLYNSIAVLKIKNYDAIVFAYNNKLIYVNFSEGNNLSQLKNYIMRSKIEEIEKSKNEYYTVKSNVALPVWTCYMIFSKRFLLYEINTISRSLLLLFIITVIISLILINYLYLDIISPINILVRYMKQVESGNTNVKIELKRGDEFGYLINSFNKMVKKINTLINRVYKSQLIAKDAQIKALQSQINPHFLFNTLDVINWKAKFAGAGEVSEMITALANLLEFNINREDSPLITLEREIEYVQSYIFLVCKRTNHLRNLNFVKNIDSDVLNCRIPFMTIQPLIENSLKHAFDSKFQNPAIYLNAFKEEDKLTIIIKDNGKGMDKAKLECINSKLKSLSQEENSHGIGLINTVKRLKLLFGNRYQFTIKSDINNGTQITIKIPFF